MSDEITCLKASSEYDPSIPEILPFQKVYSIQVGSKLYKLSGASLSSDAPSYLTNFFSQEANENRTLFIDRNPKSFDVIYKHLQGYMVSVDDAYEYIDVWLDSVYFGLSRLERVLNEDYMYMVVGGKSFKVPRSVITSRGNSPNFFTITCDNLIREGSRIISSEQLLRPPPILPCTAPNKSPHLFEDLMELLRGNDTIIKDDKHREMLIKECRYYRFLEVKERIIKHKVVTSPLNSMEQEIIIDLFDLSPDGLRKGSNSETALPLYYARPHLLNEPRRVLIVEIKCDYFGLLASDSGIKLIVCQARPAPMIKVSHRYYSKIKELFINTFGLSFVSDKESITPSILFPTDLQSTRTTINGTQVKKGWLQSLAEKLRNPEQDDIRKKRKIDTEDSEQETKYEISSGDQVAEFDVMRSLWRIIVKGDKPLFQGVLVDAVTNRRLQIEKSIDFL